jgi:hypothetical protein
VKPGATFHFLSNFSLIVRRQFVTRNLTMAEAWIADGNLTMTVPNLDAFSDDEGKPKQITSTVQEIGGLAWWDLG